MDLAELNSVEQLVLVGLVKAIVHADQQVSREEGDAIRALARKVGKEAWNRRVAEAREQFSSAEDLFNMARTVERPEAREAIHGVLRGLAESDDLIQAEAQILDWVAEVWQLGGAAGDLPTDLEDDTDPDTFDGGFVMFEEDEDTE